MVERAPLLVRGRDCWCRWALVEGAVAAGPETQSGSGTVGRIIVERGPELLVVLGVVGIVQVAEDVVGFAAGHFAVGRGSGLGIRRTEVAVAIEWNCL